LPHRVLVTTQTAQVWHDRAMSKSVTAEVLGKTFTCRLCRNPTFIARSIKLNSTGMEFLDLGWANASAAGLICTNCGYIHEFMGNTVSVHKT
jgi:predicted nucleic-acid-binding Zn-ribbon protein